MDITDSQEQILVELAEECKRNPKTSITGINLSTLGDKVGAYRGIGAMYDVDKLRRLGLVSENRNNVIITQKGLKYAKSRKNKPYYFYLSIFIVIGLLISLITDNFIALVVGVIASIIGGLILYLIQK
jgi:hypothetical protein